MNCYHILRQELLAEHAGIEAAGDYVIQAILKPQSKNMLDASENDALMSADVPKCVLEKSPKVGRLFEDYETGEREYVLRTGIFPSCMRSS
jgi:4,5-dihydroxyphthalate decarboxylase